MTLNVNSESVVYAKVFGVKAVVETSGHIDHARLLLVFLPLATPVSDAKMLTGCQRPSTEVVITIAKTRSRGGSTGVDFNYSKCTGDQGTYTRARKIVDNLLSEDPNNIDKIYTKLLWAGASVGRSDMAVQAIFPIDIVLWNTKARRAGLLLAELLGSHRDSVQCHNTSGGFLHTPLDQALRNVVTSREDGTGEIKLKVDQPSTVKGIRCLTVVRGVPGDDFLLMADANQRWDHEAVICTGREMEPSGLIRIKKPLDAYDVEGHVQLAATLDTPIVTGEMLASLHEYEQLTLGNASDFAQPDVSCVGGISSFLKITDLVVKYDRKLAPHSAIEVYLHLAAAYPLEPWPEHPERLTPLFSEQLELRDDRMWISKRHGLGFTLSEQTRHWIQ